MNRNYDFEFAYDNIGSSADPCDDNYRGPYAFSEPETRAVRNLLLNWPNIKFAINLHSYDNTMVNPFNFNSTSSDYLHTKFPMAAKFYQELIEVGRAPSNTVRNSSKSNYRVNGEASDYMLGVKQIYAISPHIGSTDVFTNTWYISSKNKLTAMLSSNYDWILYTMRRALP